MGFVKERTRAHKCDDFRQIRREKGKFVCATNEKIFEWILTIFGEDEKSAFNRWMWWGRMKCMNVPGIENCRGDRTQSPIFHTSNDIPFWRTFGALAHLPVCLEMDWCLKAFAPPSSQPPFAFRLKICKIADTSCVCRFDCRSRNLFVFYFRPLSGRHRRQRRAHSRNDKCEVRVWEFVKIEFGSMHNECKISAWTWMSLLRRPEIGKFVRQMTLNGMWKRYFMFANGLADSAIYMGETCELRKQKIHHKETAPTEMNMMCDRVHQSVCNRRLVSLVFLVPRARVAVHQKWKRKKMKLKLPSLRRIFLIAQVDRFQCSFISLD